MKKKHNEGFSLIEVLVAIVVLAAFTIPTCSSLVLSYRMNHKADEMLQAQLAVSSAVEQLMATGLTEEFQNSLELNEETKEIDDDYISSIFPGLTFVVGFDVAVREGTDTADLNKASVYSIEVQDEAGNVVVETTIRNESLKPPKVTTGGGG